MRPVGKLQNPFRSVHWSTLGNPNHLLGERTHRQRFTDGWQGSSDPRARGLCMETSKSPSNPGWGATSGLPSDKPKWIPPSPGDAESPFSSWRFFAVSVFAFLTSHLGPTASGRTGAKAERFTRVSDWSKKGKHCPHAPSTLLARILASPNHDRYGRSKRPQDEFLARMRITIREANVGVALSQRLFYFFRSE